MFFNSLLQNESKRKKIFKAYDFDLFEMKSKLFSFLRICTISGYKKLNMFYIRDILSNSI